MLFVITNKCHVDSPYLQSEPKHVLVQTGKQDLSFCQQIAASLNSDIALLITFQFILHLRLIRTSGKPATFFFFLEANEHPIENEK